MNQSKEPEYIAPEKLRSKNKRQHAGPMSKTDTAFGIFEIVFYIPRLIMYLIRAIFKLEQVADVMSVTCFMQYKR